MSILDSFYILFKGDNAQLLKATKESDKALDDFNKNQKKVDDQTNKLGTSFLDLATAGVAAFSAIFAVGKIKDGIMNTASFNAELQRTSALTGISAGDIAGWGYALQTVGSTADEFRSNLLSLNDSYAKFGQTLNLNALEKLADQFKALKDAGQQQQAIRLGQQLGIDDNFVLLLEKGSSNIKNIVEYYKQLSGVTKESSEGAREFETHLVTIGARIHGIYTALQPALSDTLKLVDLMVSGIENFIRGLTILGTGINDLARGDFKALGKDWFGVGAQAQSAAGKTGGSSAESSKFWESQGYSKSQIAALLANEQRESNFNAGAVGDNGTSFGIFQWHDPARRAAILAATGIDVTNASHADQLKAAQWELQNSGYADRLRQTNTPEAGAGVLTGFENPANAGYEASLRGQMADHIAAAQNAIGTADNSSLNANAPSSSQNTVTIGSITINTQATDAAGIAAAIDQKLNQINRNTAYNFEDGRIN